jgi:hypothetical protein
MSSSTRWLPIKPVAPVTRAFIRRRYFEQSRH